MRWRSEPRRAGRKPPLGVALLIVGIVTVLAFPASAAVNARTTTSGYPGVVLRTATPCIQQLNGTISGWVELTATNVTPGASVRIVDAQLIGLSGGREWRAEENQSWIVGEPQQYDLWNGASTGAWLTARVQPGEQFRVAYVVTSTSQGRTIPAGSENISVRIVNDTGNPLPTSQVSCGWKDTDAVSPTKATQRTIDWAKARAVQNLAKNQGLVLPTDWSAEFLRVLSDVCGYTTGLVPPSNLEHFTMLEVDNGADITVGVLGDSVTSQIRDELVADTRYNWVVASMCGGRVDHFLGDPLLPTDADLSFGLDAILDADPEVVVVALGSVDSKVTSLDAGDHADYIDEMMDQLAPVRCPMWMNVYVDTQNAEWAAQSKAYNSTLSGVASDHNVPVIDWHGAVSGAGSGPSHPWIAPGPFDSLHVTVPLGHQARVGQTLNAIEACTAPTVPPDCVSGLWDVWPESPFCADIAWFVEQEITTGYTDYTFRPTQTLTRGAVARFLHQIWGAPPLAPPPAPTFSDVPATHPFFAEIEWMASLGITSGVGDGEFRPGDPVTRASLSAYLYRLYGSPPVALPANPTFSDVPRSHALYRPIEWAADRQIISGFPNGTFAPGDDVTRQSSAAMLHRFDSSGTG